MIKLGNNNLKPYKGDYRPISAYKNTEKILGYKTSGMAGTEGSFEGTYNDYLTLYGRCGYKVSKNLCPTPKSIEDTSGEYGYKIIENSDGTFDFTGAMATGVTLATVKLSAGTYTASGCDYIQLWLEEMGEFVSLPATFTLEQDNDISVVFWYTETAELELKNQYIQIEAGEVATDFSPYCGDPDRPPSPDNVKTVIGAKGKVLTRGKNLLNISNILGTSVTANGGTLNCGMDGGITAHGVPTSSVSFGGLPKLYLPNGIYTLSRSGTFVNMSCSMYLRDADGNTLYSFGVTDADNAAKKTFNTADYPTYSYAIFEIKRSNNNIEMDGTAYFQLEEGNSATEYQPYYGENSLDALELLGLEVDSTYPYNYTETVDGVKKYYIADSLCGNVFTKRIGKLTLNGSETSWTNGVYNTAEELRLYVLHNDTQSRDDNAICSHFAVTSNIALSTQSGVFANSSLSFYNLRFLISVSKVASLDEWKAYLAEQYAAGTPVTVYYVLAEPVTEYLHKVDSETGEITPFAAKTYPRFTHISVTPDDGNLCYGMAECIRIME